MSELGTLEKGLSSTDYAKQKGALEEIVKSLRSMRLSSLEQLDLNTRGRLLTTLLRVGRQPKPPPSEVAVSEVVAPETAVSAEPSAPAEAAASESATSEGAVGEGGSTPSAEGAPVAPAPAGDVAPTPPVDPKTQGWTDVMYLIGKAWRAVGEGERAEAAFAASGRVEQKDAELPPPAQRVEGAREGRREGKGRGPKERREREPRGARPGREPLPELTGDWTEQVKTLEAAGRTRDAARLHARHGSHSEAARLFTAGGDHRGALRALLDAKDVEGARKVLSSVKPVDAKALLEKAQAWELLMELYVQGGDFENVARLYERARQFDQAGLAWERSGKLANARRAYERARDGLGVARVRGLEVAKLVERGDRLGAATLLVSGGERAEATALVSQLPPPKAFRFLQRLGLNDEAQALAKAELVRAEAENKPALRARWLENLGETLAAAQAWEAADRKERAVPLYEQLGDLPRAAALAEAAGERDKAVELYQKLNDAAGVARAQALPPPAPKSKRHLEADGDLTDGMSDAGEPVAPAGPAAVPGSEA